MQPARVPAGTDLVEWYFEQGWTDGLPVVPPTRAAVDAAVAALGGDPELVECRVPPRLGNLTREVLAVNLVMAGCKPDYAAVVRAALLALTMPAFNLNGVQATTHMAAPLLVVNGPEARTRGHERRRQRVRLRQPRQRHDRPGDPSGTVQCRRRRSGRPRQIDPRAPRKYTYAVAENEADSPWAPYHVEKGFCPDNSTVFVIAAEPPHSVTNHVADDPEGILDSICSAMSTIANNNAVSSGHCAVVIGPEHARTIAGKGWTRHDVRSYLHHGSSGTVPRAQPLTIATAMSTTATCRAGTGASPESRIPIVPSPDHIHLFVIGGAAGRFSAFIPGWGHMTAPVLRSIEATGSNTAPVCVDGTCYL